MNTQPPKDPRHGAYTENQRKYILIGMNYVASIHNAKIEELLRRHREDRHDITYEDVLDLLGPSTYLRNGTVPHLGVFPEKTT
jgi:hypothetical protein